MKAIPDPRGTGTRTGKLFSAIIKASKKRMLATDDNMTIICAGGTGSGKSTLMFHANNILTEQPLPTKQVALDYQTLAEMFTENAQNKGAFLGYDEANISKRDAMSGFNKDLVDVLFTVRAKNWILWLNNPSADYLDKALIHEELINYFIFITHKQKRFVVFTRKQLQRFYDKYGNIKLETIKKHYKEFGVLDSWFTKYSGDDWQAYLEKKESRMDDKLAAFNQKYGGERKLSTHEAAQKLGVGKTTIHKYLKKYANNKALEDAKNPLGHWKLTNKHIDFLRETMQSSS